MDDILNKHLLENEINEDHDEHINKNAKKNNKCSKCKIIHLASDKKLLMINLIHSNESEYIIVDANSELTKDDKIIIDSRYGKDIAIITGEALSMKEIPDKLVTKLIRKASEKDLIKSTKNIAKEEKAVQIFREKLEKYKLDMKLVSAHYLVDESKILFFFTADARVDFRQLVKDLVGIFKMRIELRQIGVRDESRIIGGLAVCGRDYCCHSVTDHLKPVSIKMAKEQNLSLNSMKISGPCGRLLCCLSYEYDFYRQEKKLFPSIGTFVSYEGQKTRVIELNIISRYIKLVGQDSQIIQLPLKSLNYLSRQKKWIIKSGFNDEKQNSIEIPSIDLPSSNNNQSYPSTQNKNNENQHKDNRRHTSRKYDSNRRNQSNQQNIKNRMDKQELEKSSSESLSHNDNQNKPSNRVSQNRNQNSKNQRHNRYNRNRQRDNKTT